MRRLCQLALTRKEQLLTPPTLPPPSFTHATIHPSARTPCPSHHPSVRPPVRTHTPHHTHHTHSANDFCKEGKRQTISAQDVIAALKELEFEEFVTPLEKFLEAHRKQADEARTQKAAAKSGGGGAAASAGSPTAAAGASDAAEAPAAPATDAADAPMAEAQ